MSESNIARKLNSIGNENVECFPASGFALSVSNNNANEMDIHIHDIPLKTDKEVREDEVSEASKTSGDSETNDDIDSSSSDSSTVNNIHSDCDKFSETSSQDLPDSGAQMETDIRTEVNDYTVPKVSAEDELLMEINMQLPESNVTSKSHPPNGLSTSLFNHPAYRTVIQELSQFKEQVSVLHSEISR
jgi:hypothetical protein